MEQTLAILTRKISFSESALLCTWISAQHGKVKTCARGARKMKSSFQGHLDLFYEVEICYEQSQKSDLHSLKEARAKIPTGELCYPNLALAGYFAELSEAVLPVTDEPAPEVFDLLRRGLSHLRKSPASFRALTYFEKSLCAAIGVGGNPLDALEYYCGRIPQTRAIALQALYS